MRGGGGEAEGPASAKSLGNARGGGAGFRSSAPSLVMRVVFRLTMKRRGLFLPAMDFPIWFFLEEVIVSRHAAFSQATRRLAKSSSTSLC